MGDREKSKRKQNYYMQRNPVKCLKIENNFKGFLATCNGREKDCIRESYNLLNKYADKLYPQNETNSASGNNSIEDSLQQEIAALRAPQQRRRFQSVDSGARNIIFIATTLEDPVNLIEKIVEDINENKKQQTRYLLRLTPVEVICRADKDEIVRKFKPLAEKYFKGESQIFSIIINHRNNDAFKKIKGDVIKVVADEVTATRDDHKVDLKGAKISILIDVIRGFAFLAVVRNYLQYKKYNLLINCDVKSGIVEGADSSVTENIEEITDDSNNKKN